jgi:hypothetical protein
MKALKTVGITLSAVMASVLVPLAVAGALYTQAPVYISNTTMTAPLGATIHLSATGGSGTGALSFKATGTACVLHESNLTASAPTSCSVIATRAASSQFQAASSQPKVFTFTGKPQAPLVITNAVRTFLVDQTVKVTYAGGSGTGLVTILAIGTGCTYSSKTGLLTASTFTTCTLTATRAASGTFAPVSSNPVVFVINPATFQITNRTLTGQVGTPITVTAAGGTAAGSPSFSVQTPSSCSISTSTGVLDATAAGTCRVSATLVHNTVVVATASPVTFTFAPAPNIPTVTHPDVASLVSITGTSGPQIDDTANGDAWFINQYYNANDHWYANYFNAGATITMKWHVNGANGLPLANTGVTLISNLDYSNAKGVTWGQTGLNVYPGGGSGPQGALAGTTDANGNVTFILNNTNTDSGPAPADTTTTAGVSTNEGPYNWTDMVLQVGSDTFTGDPATTVNQGTDRVDFIEIPVAPVTPPSSPSYLNPDVATMTGVTGTVNQPIDYTANGDQWFIDAYYSPGDHWNFTYVTAGSTFNVTWHVVGFNNKVLADQPVTLMTGFAGPDRNWSAPGMDAQGNIAGTTDASGNVTFTITNTDTSALPAPTATDGATALGAESTNPWTRMALVIGGPVTTNTSTGAIGSATDTVTAASTYIGQVNQATDLPDFIVTS